MRQFTYFWTLLQPGTSRDPVIELDLCIVLTACQCSFLDNGLWHRRIITKKSPVIVGYVGWARAVHEKPLHVLLAFPTCPRGCS